MQPLLCTNPPGRASADHSGTAAEPTAGEILERDAALDGLRGIAIGLVLLDHAFGYIYGGRFLAFVRRLIDSMAIGVDLFFVLSGFLITSILLRTRGSRGYFLNFYARRTLRIFPAYYLVLAAVFLAGPAFLHGFPDHAQVRQDAPYFLLYMQNFVIGWRSQWLLWEGLGHTWSLAIEEQFYLVWPAIIAFVPSRRLLGVCLLIAAVSIAAKIGMSVAGVSWWTVYMSTFSHMEGLAAGAALAVWTARSRGRTLAAGFRVAGALAGLLLGTELLGHALGYISADVHAVALIVIAVLFFVWLLHETISATPTSALRRALQFAPLTFLGKYSYGLYLFHVIVITHLRLGYLPALQAIVGGKSGIVLLGLGGISLSILLAMAMFHGFERPILLLKRYFVPARAVNSLHPQAAVARPTFEDGT